MTASDLSTSTVIPSAHWPWGLPFEMVRTAGVKVAWSNRRLPFVDGEAALLNEYAWHVPARGSLLGNEDVSKTFYAECYGGDGIHHNGGGVRCAWQHPWIVKGIGVNLLSGYSDEAAASYRNNGRASLSEILVEAVWGEVLHYALPFGAVRMTAVISTGEFIANGTQTSAGVGVRQFVWRPAHFMRAPGFHVRPENRRLIPSDTARVKEAIPKLPEMLPMPPMATASALEQLTPIERLKLGLREMVRRFAEQMAAAKAKRLSHGTLSTSNISLDGRWNDLNSVSALPSYGFRRNMAPFWSDQMSLHKSIELLCFYVHKYFPQTGLEPEDLPSAEWLSAIYGRYYEDALARRFVGLCGYPHTVSNKVWNTVQGKQAMQDLADLLIAMARSGHSPRRPFDDDMQNNSVRGDYEVTKILKALSRARGAADADLQIAELVPARRVRQMLIQQYMVVKSMMVDEAGRQAVEESLFSRLIALNCAKTDRNISSLYRNVLFDSCNAIAHPDLPAILLRERAVELIEPLIDEARVIYQEARDFTTLLWCKGLTSVLYDARKGELMIDLGDAASLQTFPLMGCDPDAKNTRNSVIRSMEDYWGSKFLEIMR